VGAVTLIDVPQQYFSGSLEIQYPPHQESLPNIAKAIDAAIAINLGSSAVAGLELVPQV
jgi:hypothetical protein